MNIKLPKQWRDWCRSMKLKPSGPGKDQYRWFYLKGRGYHWRVNMYADFQLGDTYKDFDRWAMCDINEVDLPKSKTEFQNVVRELLKARKEWKS